MLESLSDFGTLSGRSLSFPGEIVGQSEIHPTHCTSRRFCRVLHGRNLRECRGLLSLASLERSWANQRSIQHIARVGASAESSMEAIQESAVACFLQILSEYFNGAQCFEEASPGTSSSQNYQGLCGSSSVDKFDQLHQELSKLLVGRDCDKKLIYLGSEVKFTRDGDVRDFIYQIEGTHNQIGPVNYG